MAGGSSKAKVFVWSPVILDRTVRGDKVNEVARIRELSQTFDLDAYVLADSRGAKERREISDLWFDGPPSNVHYLPTLRGRVHFLPNLLVLGVYVSMVLLIKSLSERIDLVLTRFSVASLPVLAACRILRIRSVFNVPAAPFEYKDSKVMGGVVRANPLFRTLTRASDYGCLSLCNYIAIPSPAARVEVQKDLGRGIGSKIIALPHPIPAYFFDQNLRRWDGDETVLKFLGNIHPKYDFLPLVQAVGVLGEKGMKISLQILSSGSGADWAERLLGGNVPPNVSQTDASYPRRRVPALLQDATAVVVPLKDGVTVDVTLKSIEAMALGIPVLQTRLTDPELLVDGRTCIGVGRNTSEDWQAALVRLQDKSLVERVIAGGKKVADLYRPGRSGEVLSSLIQKG